MSTPRSACTSTDAAQIDLLEPTDADEYDYSVPPVTDPKTSRSPGRTPSVTATCSELLTPSTTLRRIAWPPFQLYTTGWPSSRVTADTGMHTTFCWRSTLRPILSVGP